MSETEKKKIGVGYFVLGGMSFIPLIGVLFGIITIILATIGLATGKGRSAILLLVGILGIGFTVLIYGTLFHMMGQKDGIFAQLQKQLMNDLINQTVRDVEFYKVEHGNYPEKLLDIVPVQTQADVGKKAPDMRSLDLQFYYKLTDDKKHYYLLGVGEDKEPFTADDILPNVDNSKGNLGLVINK